jgi:hypothetical protein
VSGRRAWLPWFLAPLLSCLAGAAAPVAAAAQSGARCPEGFHPLFDDALGVLRCRRSEVRWVVTTCADAAYARYEARPGRDTCRPTPVPGAGIPPGAGGSRPVACAGGPTTAEASWEVVPDRTGDRDRCERAEHVYTAPLAIAPAAAERPRR